MTPTVVFAEAGPTCSEHLPSQQKRRSEEKQEEAMLRKGTCVGTSPPGMRAKRVSKEAMPRAAPPRPQEPAGHSLLVRPPS